MMSNVIARPAAATATSSSRAPQAAQRRQQQLSTVLVLAVLLLVLGLLGSAGGPRPAAALKCYICNNCLKYELSQSRPCTPEQTKCMKMDMQTGQVQRGCGTEAMCTDSDTELKTSYTAVNCCEEDNCNAGPAAARPGGYHTAVLLLLLLALVAAAAAPNY